MKNNERFKREVPTTKTEIMSKEQTAVNWLIENYLPLKRGIELGHKHTLKVVEQAQELEKKQKTECLMAFMNTDGITNEKELAEQYYNEKYN